MQAAKAAALAPGYEPTPLRAQVTAEGRSGVRRIRVRDFQVLTDSPPSLVGYDLGPSSPELALGALGSCLTHSYLIQAALLGVPVTTLAVEVTGQIDARAGQPGYADIPVYPHDLAYTVQIDSPASDQDLAGFPRRSSGSVRS
ncbi:MAG: OsmC family protein [Acetobacteraceae bacterium]